MSRTRYNKRDGILEGARPRPLGYSNLYNLDIGYQKYNTVKLFHFYQFKHQDFNYK